MDAITANHQRIQESRTDEYEDGYVIPATGSYPMLSLNLAQTDCSSESGFLRRDFGSNREEFQ